jgi:DNA adenine methylase
MIPYIGGKARLSSHIISHFPEDFRLRTYIEVFGGGGWVLFKKDESYLEVYNDLNSDLVNLFKTIRDNYPEFQHRADWTLHSREMYKEAADRLKDDKFLTDVERAMHYAIRRVQAFSGRGGWAMQVTADKVTSGHWLPFLKRIELIHARLKRVQIECLDFETIIRKYDSQTALFYCDPPYIDSEHYYDVKFTREDHYRLAELLLQIKGKFALSYYDNPLLNNLYKGCRRVYKEVSKSSSGITRATGKKERPKAREMLIMNY